MSNTAKSAMETVQIALDSYERSLGLLHTNNIDEAEINGYLTLGRNDIEQLDPISANCIAVRLHQFAFHIQRQYNVEQSRLSWSDAEIVKYASDKVDQVGSQYTKYENRLRLLAQQDEYLSKLLAIKNYAQQRLDRLCYLASSINNLASTFLSCAKTKVALRERN